MTRFFAMAAAAALIASPALAQTATAKNTTAPAASKSEVKTEKKTASGAKKKVHKKVEKKADGSTKSTNTTETTPAKK